MREIRDVEQISRTALADVRNAISGYRATWADEVANARSMLETAGIRGEFTGQPAALARGIEETLALVVREAITNVVRHAARPLSGAVGAPWRLLPAGRDR